MTYVYVIRKLLFKYIVIRIMFWNKICDTLNLKFTVRSKKLLSNLLESGKFSYVLTAKMNKNSLEV